MNLLDIKISGVIVSSNFYNWKSDIEKHIQSINLTLINDNDFVQATDDSKRLKEAEILLKSAKEIALKNTEEIKQLFVSIDELAESIRQKRLKIDRQIKERKQSIKDGLVDCAIMDIKNYLQEKPAYFHEIGTSKYIERYQFEAAIKGKSTLNSVENSLNSLVQQIKSGIDYELENTKENNSLLEGVEDNKKFLFQDTGFLLSLPADNLKLQIENRISKLAESILQSKLESIDERIDYMSVDIDSAESFSVVIEIICSKNDAVEYARKIKLLTENNKIVHDVKLKRRNLS